MTDISQPPVHINWTLVVDDGSNATKVFPVTRGSLTIGRATTADIRLDNAHISRHHARLNRQGELLLVEDLNTVNGTFVNGQAITTPYALQPGDLISFGSCTIRVEKGVVPVPPPQAETRAAPYIPAETKSSLNWILLVAAGVVGLSLIALIGVGLYWLVFRNPGTSSLIANSTRQGPDITINQAPTPNSPIPINRAVTVQTLASDPGGVTRVELWVNGRKVDEMDTELVQVAPSLNAALEWLPTLPGVHALEVRAYNEAGVVNIQPVGSFRVVGEANTPTSVPSPSPSPTIVPLLPNVASAEQPTPTLIPPIPTSVRPTPTLIPPIPTSVIPAIPASSQPSLTVNSPTVNVRTGPSTQYDPVGQLRQGAQVEVVGVANVGQGQWWQIPFAAAPDGFGWVSGDPAFVSASNTAIVPVINAPLRPTAVAVAAAPVNSAPSTPLPPTDTPTPTPMPVAAPAAGAIIHAPAGKTLLIISNRSLRNQPALLTLSEGKSVGGGRQIDTPAGQEVKLVLEPDLYRAMWSSPAPRGGFVRSADFVASPNKIVVLWVRPEDRVAEMEEYDQLIGVEAAVSAETATPTPAAAISGYAAPPGKALFIAANRSLNNSFGIVTVSGGSFGGGKEIKLDAGVEIPLEVLPGNYRAIWSSPAPRGNFAAGHDFKISAGEVIITWIVPEAGAVFIQLPGQAPLQIN